MIWLRQLRGLKVVCKGKCIGRAVHGMMSDDLTMLDGIWADRALLGLRFIAAEHICVIGKNSITVDSAGERLRIKPERLFLRAVTTDGRRAGAVTDAGIDAQTLTVKALRITTGWLSEALDRSCKVYSFKYDSHSSRVIIHGELSETEVLP